FFKNFKIIFVRNIPKLEKSMLNEIRRFTLFIDEGYEAKKQFYFLSKCSLKNLELQTAEIPYFSRTISRIHELSKIPKKNA
ncbi:MAG: AFG1/ZapE family ATPase, partial [Alphaproteobacteria bacterium]